MSAQHVSALGRGFARGWELVGRECALVRRHAITATELVKTVTYYENNMQREINVSIVGAGVSTTNAA